MPILESIAAANAAYSVIRTALSNGRETAGLIGAVGKFIGAEEDVKDALAKKKRNPIAAIAGGQQGEPQCQEACRGIFGFAVRTYHCVPSHCEGR